MIATEAKLHPRSLRFFLVLCNMSNVSGHILVGELPNFKIWTRQVFKKPEKEQNMGFLMTKSLTINNML